MSCIYKITNDINGKMYVGKTSYTIEKRWVEHCKASKSQRKAHCPLYNAMRKYGIEHFSISLIEECNDYQASERECFWIEQYDTYKHGYNATLGGDGGHTIDHNHIVEEYERLKSVNDVAAEMGINPKTVSNVLRWRGISTDYRHGVEMIDADGGSVANFESVSDAAEYIVWLLDEPKKENVRKRISRASDRPDKTAYGFIWRSFNLDKRR